MDGLATYEKNTNATATSLYGAIMLMKAGCSNNQSYVDKFSSSFVRVIQRLAREHNSSANVETIGIIFSIFMAIEFFTYFYLFFISFIVIIFLTM